MQDKKTAAEKLLDAAEKAGINTGNIAAVTALAQGRIFDALTASIPGGIEASEALGQQELVQGQQLPKDGLLEHRERLEAIGFVFGKEIDDVFIEVKLPPDWTKQATEHSMHSDLLDGKGRRRAGIFYKAAFYDRHGHMMWAKRFDVEVRLEDGRIVYKLGEDEEAHCYAVVLDAGSEIHRTRVSEATLRRSDRGFLDSSLERELIGEGQKWLDERYPNWRDRFAHWDD